MEKKGAGFWRRHRWLKWTFGAFAVVCAVLTTVVLIVAHRAEPMLRARIIQGLEDHFQAHVELDNFHIELRNGLWAEGKGLRIWPPAEVEGVEVPGSPGGEHLAKGKPLIDLREFRFHTPLHYDAGKPIRITVVQLEGLNIDVPPGPHFNHDLHAVTRTTSSNARASNAGSPNLPQHTRSGGAASLLQFQLESVECKDARLTVETSKPGKPPLEFAIAHMKLTGIQPGLPMTFEAELTNARPKGKIQTHGNLGPWLVADPGETPISGDYLFEHADLSDFKGIAGILSSAGHYQGTLRNMTVDGETDTPNFRLTRFGTALHLHTKFHALVDGTNGDTQLDPVDAILDNSHFRVWGQVVRAVAVQSGSSAVLPRGHDIALTLDVDRGRIEDFMRLMSRSGVPLLNGALNLKGQLHIPPGTTSAQDRMDLRGTFVLDDARFTSAKVQDRVGELSQRGQGNAKDAKTADTSNVRSAMKGNFQMVNGVITLPALQYTVPGAVVDLKGTYGVDNGVLNFVGTARMQATVSQMVGGWKGLLLKPVDRFFEKNGAGTQVPIRIDGTRDDPHFAVDFNRMKTSSPQRPDQPK